jgi:hypothetical protein
MHFQCYYKVISLLNNHQESMPPTLPLEATCSEFYSFCIKVSLLFFFTETKLSYKSWCTIKFLKNSRSQITYDFVYWVPGSLITRNETTFTISPQCNMHNSPSMKLTDLGCISQLCLLTHLPVCKYWTFWIILPVISKHLYLHILANISGVIQ